MDGGSSGLVQECGIQQATGDHESEDLIEPKALGRRHAHEEREEVERGVADGVQHGGDSAVTSDEPKGREDEDEALDHAARAERGKNGEENRG